MQAQKSVALATHMWYYITDGGDRMTDYELIMIVLTILSLLIAVEYKNRK